MEFLTPKGITPLPTNVPLPSGSGTAGQTTANNSAMWGGIAGAAAGLFNTAATTLNPKVRAANVAIAEANARAAEANATTQKAESFDPKFIIAGIIVVVLIIALMMRSKSN